MRRKNPPVAVETGGAIAHLWREFTDPGPAGDTLTMLKKYSDGIFPGCMGLLFMAVGLGVASAFFFNAKQDKAWMLPVFGGIFALAGFGVFRVGLKIVASKASSPVAADDDADAP